MYVHRVVSYQEYDRWISNESNGSAELPFVSTTTAIEYAKLIVEHYTHYTLELLLIAATNFSDFSQKRLIIAKLSMRIILYHV